MLVRGALPAHFGIWPFLSLWIQGCGSGFTQPEGFKGWSRGPAALVAAVPPSSRPKAKLHLPPECFLSLSGEAGSPTSVQCQHLSCINEFICIFPGYLEYVAQWVCVFMKNEVSLWTHKRSGSCGSFVNIDVFVSPQPHFEPRRKLWRVNKTFPRGWVDSNEPLNYQSNQN